MQKSDNLGISQLMPVRRFIDDAADTYVMTQRDHDLVRDLRYVMHENQTQFWRRFGVTQTQGSRFERGKSIPLPVLLLIRLYLMRIVSDGDLQQVREPDFCGSLETPVAPATPAGRSGPGGSP